PLTEMGRGLLPSRPRHDAAHYWYLAAGILGATLTPYIFYFYSTGAVEDKWTKADLGLNRLVAWVGMGLGGVLSASVLVVTAMLFILARRVDVDAPRDRRPGPAQAHHAVDGLGGCDAAVRGPAVRHRHERSPVRR